MTLNWLFHFFPLLASLHILSFGRKSLKDSLTILLVALLFVVLFARWLHGALKSSLNNFLINIQFSRYLINMAWSRHSGWERRLGFVLSCLMSRGSTANMSRNVFPIEMIIQNSFHSTNCIFTVSARLLIRKSLQISREKKETQKHLRFHHSSEHLAFHRFDNAKIDVNVCRASSSSLIFQPFVCSFFSTIGCF